MEPNPAGVSALTVVNPGRPERNPFQWISGRGQRHQHESPPYRTIAGALGWKQRHEGSGAKLYPVDEYGTVVSRAVGKRNLKRNRKRRTKQMAYNIGALRRAMKSNKSYAEGWEDVFGKGRRGKKRRGGAKTTAGRSGVTFGAMGMGAGRSAKRGRSRRRRHSPGPVGIVQKKRRKAAARKAARTRAANKARRSRAARKAARTRKRRGGLRKKSGRRKSRKSRRTGRRRSKRAFRFRGRRFNVRHSATPGAREGIAAGRLPGLLRVGRLFNRPSILMGSLRGVGGKRRRRSGGLWFSRGRGGRRRSKKMSRNSRRRRSRRSRGIWGNRRRSRRRRSRRNPKYIVTNRRRRRSRRMSRNSRRRRRLRRNMLGQGRVRRVKGGWGRGRGPMGQLVEFGPHSGRRSGRRYSGYPVYVPGHLSTHGYVRRYRKLGGAALAAHRRKSSMKANRRRSMRRNPKYVVQNRRRRRGRRHSMKANRRHRMRRNQFLGVQWMSDVVKPVAAGTAGFVAARVLSNAVANIDAISGKLGADNTKLLATGLGIVGTLALERALAPKVPILSQNRGAIVTGMGLALVDRLLGKVTGGAAAYLGEYFEDPSAGMGEYVDQPLGAYVSDPSMGEYVDQPLSGLGTMYATAGMGTLYAAAGMGYAEGADPSDQGAIDRQMNVAEAAAGVEQAAAGTLYAAAGLGADAQPPFVSIERPTDMARNVTAEMPYVKPVAGNAVAREAWGGPGGFSTPEGKGYAGGMFARHLFSGMMGS